MKQTPDCKLLAQHTAPPPPLEEAYKHCRRIALGRLENFPVVSWLLPRALRPHIYAVYAYCRGVDDLGDVAEGDRLALLDDWERDLRAAYDGSPSDPRFVLLDYCTYSANPVGHLVLYVFGYRDPVRQGLSDATCTALQLTNFWQDVTDDLDQDRIYIPQEDLERFGVTEDDLRSHRVTPDFRRLMAFEVRRTREIFDDGLGLIGVVSGRLRTDLRLFTLSGLAVLDQIASRGHDVLTTRPALSRRRKAVLAARGFLPLPVRARR